MTIEKIGTAHSFDPTKVAQIMALYQAVVATQVESVKAQKREALIASVVELILALLGQIRGKGLSADVLVCKIYRVLEIVALLGIADRPEIMALITKLKHLVQIYLRVQLDITGMLSEIRYKGPVHSPKLLEIKLAQLCEMAKMSDADMAGIRFELSPGVDLSKFQRHVEATALTRFKAGVSELGQMPLVRKYHKKASDMMAVIPLPGGFLSAMASKRRRLNAKVVSILK